MHYRRTDALYLLIFQYAQQPGLGRQRNLPNFVQHERPAIGVLENALSVLNGAGKGALNATKQFSFQQAFRPSRTVAGDERTGGARPQTIKRSCGQFLSRTCFARQQHRSKVASDAVNFAKYFKHQRTSSHHTLELKRVHQFTIQLAAVLTQASVGKQFSNLHYQLHDRDRFHQIVAGTSLYCFDGRLGRVMRRHKNNVDTRIHLQYLFQSLDTS